MMMQRTYVSPRITVGITDRQVEVFGHCGGYFSVERFGQIAGRFSARVESEELFSMMGPTTKSFVRPSSYSGLEKTLSFRFIRLPSETASTGRGRKIRPSREI